MASQATDIKGTSIHLIAQVIAKPDQAENIAKHLKAIQVNARSNETEPGCSVYNVLRYEDSFCVVEHYDDVEAVNVHMASTAFQAFAKELEQLTLPGTFVLKFFSEV